MTAIRPVTHLALQGGMTLDRLADHLSRHARTTALAVARAVDRLQDIPRGWHHAIRALAVALVLWVAGGAAYDHAFAASGRGRDAGDVVATGPAPVVAKLQMKKPLTASLEPQVIPITGANFTPGMTARLTSPLEEDTTTFPAFALERLTPTSFELRTALETPGTYELTVRTPDGQRSNAITITVKK